MWTCCTCIVHLAFVFVWYKEQMNAGTSHKNTCPSMAAVEHLSCDGLLFNYSLYMLFHWFHSPNEKSLLYLYNVNDTILYIIYF